MSRLDDDRFRVRLIAAMLIGGGIVLVAGLIVRLWG